MTQSKDNVFVHVKDIDESRELLKVLEEAGEPIYEETELGLSEWHQYQKMYPYIIFDRDLWVGVAESFLHDTMKQVTTNELRQILSSDPLNTDIAKLKDKYPDYCFTIIVEKR